MLASVARRARWVWRPAPGTRGNATAILGDAWRSALVSAVQEAPPSTPPPSPVLVSRDVKNQDEEKIGTLTLAASAPLSLERPGNGGMRLWNYTSREAADVEALGLAQGMEIKHATYNTGFSGAKLVCASSTPIETWNQADKKQLMDAAASMLTEFNGAMYTGCDMNTTTGDMDYLAERCPYVLAAVGNPECCPNTATAYGVLGAVEATFGGSVKGKSILVHGCGNVGSVVASKLVELGAAKVMTVDVDPQRAKLPGTTPLSADAAWWATPCDALVPCSASGLLTAERSKQLKCTAIVGATNLPFESEEARRVAEAERGVTFVPEGLSSAGAVVVDSIEYYANRDFSSAPPVALYEFTRRVIAEKVALLLTHAQRLRVAASLVVPLVAEHRDVPVGARFAEWRKEHGGRTPELLASDGDGLGSGLLRLSEQRRADMRSSFVKAQIARCIAPVMMGSSSGGGGGVRAARALSSLSSPSSSSPSSSSPSSSSPSSQHADVVIVGGGIMGLNIAYQLRRRSPGLSVLVLERGAALGNGSSGYSTGFQRAYYSFDETMQFALDGMEAYKHWTDYTRDASASAKFTETGALWMLGYDRCQNDAMVDRLAKFGVASDVLDEAEMRRRYPMMSTDPFPTYDEEGNELPVDYAPFSAVFEHGCGHIDSSTCLEDLLRACRRDGAEVRMRSRVSRFVTHPSGGRCVGVEMEDGAKIEAGVAVVNASGPWFNKLNETVGLELSTTALPTRIQVGHKWIPDEYCDLPFVADGWGPSGIYFMPRRANNQLVFGSVAHRFESELVDPDDYNTALDPDVKQDYLNCLFHRLPGLPRDGEIVGFSSMYTVNQDDVHPMIGETSVQGLWACNGFSGHGFKLAPAVGSLVAQQITGAVTDLWETSVPHDFMGPYREPLTLKVKTHFA